MSTADIRRLQVAHKMAARSSHPSHQLAAILVRGGAIIAFATNLSRRYKHAEHRVLSKADAKGAILYVVRRNGRISKPCKNCLDQICKSGVKRVVFVGNDGVEDVRL